MKRTATVLFAALACVISGAGLYLAGGGYALAYGAGLLLVGTVIGGLK